ncbi:hypothetical protein [Nocardia carnea]|uniref:hypothetical protein n=1 Tax=Nocardia carnea TaxID=37328 RepID=UPI002455CEEE|nr:hypothetical protein [Nocardia carnea]
MIRVIHLRGTNEPSGPGVSDAFLGALDPDRFKPVRVEYPADYGVNVPFRDSYAAGRIAAIDAIHAEPGPFLLSGYSQGAYIAGDLALDIATEFVGVGIDRHRMRGVALIADPKRPAGAGCPGIPTPPGHGIAGQRPVPGVPVWWGTASRDGIAALPADNPLRSVADLSKAFTLHPRGWLGWAEDMYQRLTGPRIDLQLWWRFRFRPARWAQAVNALAGYLVLGEHDRAYLHEYVCRRLALHINQEIR